MWGRNKRDHYFRTSLLVINCVACVAIVYIYLKSVDDPEKNIADILSENSIQAEKLTSENCTPVCDSRACLWQANMFLRHIDSTVDPCDNFHSFLCGGFQREFGPEEASVLILEPVKTLSIMLKNILENIQAEPGSRSAKMKTVYESCVNYGSSELQGTKELLNTLGIMNWPHLEENFSFGDVILPAVLANFLTYGVKQYISLRTVTGNETHEGYLRVSFSEDMFNSTTEISRESAVSMLKYFDLETEDINRIISDQELVKNSIISLHKSFKNNEEEEDDSVVYVDCSRQNGEDWNDFCETVGHFFNFVSMKSGINTNVFRIKAPKDSFLKNLFPLLRSFPNRTLANFIVLTLLKGYQAELNFYFRLSKLKHKDFNNEGEILFYEIDRKKYCVSWIAKNMKVPLENEFFRQYLSNGVTEEIINIYKDFISELNDLLPRQEWIPPELKSDVVEEMQYGSNNIDEVSRVFPNDTYVDKFYEKFFPRSESFFGNVLRLKKLTLIHEMSIDSFTREDNIPYLSKFEVGASAAGFYLYINYGMLIPPFYVPGHLKVLNRIFLAPIFGHEFGHSIFFEIVYKLSDNQKFREKLQCLSDQFSRFKFEYLNEHLDGSIYGTENFADNTAVTFIEKFIEQYPSSKEIILPGLPYSAKQLLYMSSVQMWCSKSNLEEDIRYKYIDRHTPAKFRLLGMMQNSRGHASAFHCPSGSFMNPETKCLILDTN